MAIKKNKIQKITPSDVGELLSLDKKIKDLVALGEREKAASKSLEFIVAAGVALSGFYGGGAVGDLKSLLKVLLSINLPESQKFIKEFLQLDSIKRKSEMTEKKLENFECRKIMETAEEFFEWVKKMLPPSGGEWRF